jgi:hypothetical protein
MLSALYFPHTQIKDIGLLKQALLLWDQIEYIVPDKEWQHKRSDDNVFNEVIDIVAKPHCPDAEEKRLVHDRVKDLVEKGLPEWFFLEDDSGEDTGESLYAVYPDKFAGETWHLLEHNQYARFDQNISDYYVNQTLGLMIMSLLADVCAGTTKQKVTDRIDSYTWLSKYATAELGGEYIKDFTQDDLSSHYERLITISLKVLNTDEVPIPNLIAMRKREASEGGTDYRDFRVKYSQKVSDSIDRLRQPGNTAADRQEIERQFEKEMESDLANVRKDLGVARNKLLFSKEVGVSILAVAGAFANPIAGFAGMTGLFGSLGIGALVKAGVEYKGARRKALKDGAMSWLYLANRKIQW